MSWVLDLSILLSIFVCIYVRLIMSGYLLKVTMHLRSIWYISVNGYYSTLFVIAEPHWSGRHFLVKWCSRLSMSDVHMLYYNSVLYYEVLRIYIVCIRTHHTFWYLVTPGKRAYKFDLNFYRCMPWSLIVRGQRLRRVGESTSKKLYHTQLNHWVLRISLSFWWSRWERLWVRI